MDPATSVARDVSGRLRDRRGAPRRPELGKRSVDHLLDLRRRGHVPDLDRVVAPELDGVEVRGHQPGRVDRARAGPQLIGEASRRRRGPDVPADRKTALGEEAPDLVEAALDLAVRPPHSSDAARARPSAVVAPRPDIGAVDRAETGRRPVEVPRRGLRHERAHPHQNRASAAGTPSSRSAPQRAPSFARYARRSDTSLTHSRIHAAKPSGVRVAAWYWWKNS